MWPQFSANHPCSIRYSPSVAQGAYSCEGNLERRFHRVSCSGIMVGGGPEVFSSASTRWSKFEEKSGPALANLVSLAQQIADSDSFEDSEKRQCLVMLQENIHKMVRIETEAMKRKEACQAISSVQMREHQYQEPIENFMALYENHMNNATRAAQRLNVSRSAHSQTITQLIQALDSTGDEEISLQPGGTRITTKCPILSTDIKNPMKNDGCGHVYSYDGALMFLQQRHAAGRRIQKLEDFPANLKCRCPVAGCPRLFGSGSLKRDFATELSQRQLQSSSRPNENTEVADVDMLD